MSDELNLALTPESAISKPDGSRRSAALRRVQVLRLWHNTAPRQDKVFTMVIGAADNPVAFVSHASEDKVSFAERLSRGLAGHGVRPWLDKWEFKPDSLVQRLFDEGLKTAEAVIVIAYAVSVTKPWVREELDQATVRRIQNGTRLIPVRLDGVDMPAPLLHLKWIEAERTPADIARVAGEIADVIHGYNDRPSVARRRIVRGKHDRVIARLGREPLPRCSAARRIPRSSRDRNQPWVRSSNQNDRS